MQYRVKWKDYSSGDNSWEPQLNLLGVKELTDRFDDEYPRSMKEHQAMKGQSERVRREMCTRYVVNEQVERKFEMTSADMRECELGEYVGGIDEEASRVYEVVVQTITSES